MSPLPGSKSVTFNVPGVTEETYKVKEKKPKKANEPQQVPSKKTKPSPSKKQQESNTPLPKDKEELPSKTKE